MSQTSRWHPVTCAAPDTAVIDSRFLWCRKCASLFNPESIKLHSAPLPQIPTEALTPQRQGVALSWLSSVSGCFHQGHSRDTLTDHDNDNPTVLESYVHRTLTFTDEVRILELSKGTAGDPLHGTLTRCRLQNFAAYEALSYTWACYDREEEFGDTSIKDIIYLGPFWDIFLITRNCNEALRRLRYPDRTRLLWVDSVCINQENEDERGHQVRLMQRIYKNALSVVVYLGDEDADSSIALHALRSPESLQHSTRREQDALTALFRRPYFSRLWIVQEMALAKSLHFYCGPSDTFISVFSGSTLESLLNLGGTVPAWIKYSALRQSPEPRRLWSLLQDTISCQCSDPRDKLFGIVSLVTENSDKELRPDYSLSVEEVYTGIAAYFIKEEGLLHVLELAARTPQSKSLPSWAPNWESCTTNAPRWIPSPSRYLPRFRASSGTPNTVIRKFYRDPLVGDGDDHPSYINSMTGTITVEGILFVGHTSDADRAGHEGFQLRNHNQTLSITFSFLNEGSVPRDFDESNETKMQPTIDDHQSVLLLGPNYSHALLLEPIDGKEEYTLLKVGEMEAFIHAADGILLPNLLCLLPLSTEEIALEKNGVISWPDDFPLLMDLGLLQKSQNLGYLRNHRDQIVIQILRDLLADEFLAYYEIEMEMWSRWQALEKRWMPTILDPAIMESIAGYIHSFKGSNNGEIFLDEFDVGFGTRKCSLANFFSLFIFDPYKKSVTTRDTTTEKNNSNEDFRRNKDPRLALDGLSHWKTLSFDLLRHISNAPLRPARYINVLPGRNIPETAGFTWDYFMKMGDIVCRGNPSWHGWYTWFMAKKIARQQPETRPPQRRDSNGMLKDIGKWEWNHLKTTMEKRSAILKELKEFRRQLKYEKDRCDYDVSIHQPEIRRLLSQVGYDIAAADFDLSASKLRTRKLMKQVGYDLDDDRIRYRRVTIR